MAPALGAGGGSADAGRESTALEAREDAERTRTRLTSVVQRRQYSLYSARSRLTVGAAALPDSTPAMSRLHCSSLSSRRSASTSEMLSRRACRGCHAGQGSTSPRA
jgi:hypothetical protein